MGCGFSVLLAQGKLLDGLEMRLCGCWGTSQQAPCHGARSFAALARGESPNFLPPRKKKPPLAPRVAVGYRNEAPLMVLI